MDTSKAIELAEALGCEATDSDSRMVYDAAGNCISFDEILQHIQQIPLKISDIESALSDYYGREIKISEISCEVFVESEMDNAVGSLVFKAEGEEWLSDSALWGRYFFINYIDVSLPEIGEDDEEYDYKSIYEKLFAFDAEKTFQSIDWYLLT